MRTVPPPSSAVFNARRRQGNRGFTLIEMMVAVLVIAIVMALSVPNLLAKTRKDPLTQATIDFIDACRNARELAIVRGTSMQVRIAVDTQSTSLTVEPAPRRDASRWIGEAVPSPLRPSPGSSDETTSTPKPSQLAPFNARFDDSVAFSTLHVNLREVQGGDNAVTLRFHPNGTCDQFEGILHHNVLGDRKVTLEVTTGWAEVVTTR